MLLFASRKFLAIDDAKWNSDCDDTNPNIFPGAIEICGNGIDEDCNGADLPCPPPLSTFYRDADGDGFGNPALSQLAATQPLGFVLDNTDCNDNNPNINPGAIDICGNFIDEDCNGKDCDAPRPTAGIVQDISVQPNPANNVAIVGISSSLKTAMPIKLRLSNSQGMVVSTQQYKLLPGKNQFQINLSKLPPGVYTLAVNSSTLFRTMKIIKTKK